MKSTRRPMLKSTHHGLDIRRRDRPKLFLPATIDQGFLLLGTKWFASNAFFDHRKQSWVLARGHPVAALLAFRRIEQPADLPFATVTAGEPSGTNALKRPAHRVAAVAKGQCDAQTFGICTAGETNVEGLLEIARGDQPRRILSNRSALSGEKRRTGQQAEYEARGHGGKLDHYRRPSS